MSNKESVYVSKVALAKVIFSLTGQENVLSIHRPYIAMLGGDAAAALFLEQLIYWSDKGHREDGFIYKSRKEWTEEIGLSPGTQRRVCDKLERLGLVETKLHRANGAPTLHYRVDGNALIEALAYSVERGEAFQPEKQMDLQGGTNGFVEGCKSLTEITAETTTSTLTQSVLGTTNTNIEGKDITPTNVEHQADTGAEPEHVDEKLTGGYVTPNGRMITPEELAEELRAEKELALGEYFTPDGKRCVLPEEFAQAIGSIEQEPDLAPDGYPEAIFDFKTPAPRRKQTEVDRYATIAAAMDAYQKRHAPGGACPIGQEWSGVPTYQGQILTEFYALSGIASPTTKALRNPATYAAETMYAEAGSAAEAIRRLRKFFSERADGKHDFTITGPSSVVKMICAMTTVASGPKVIRVGG